MSTPEQIIASNIARCFGTGHVWRKTKLYGCETCAAEHDGFACDVCDRCVDAIHDKALYEIIVKIGFLPEIADEDDSQSEDVASGPCP